MIKLLWTNKIITEKIFSNTIKIHIVYTFENLHINKCKYLNPYSNYSSSMKVIMHHHSLLILEKTLLVNELD